MNETCKVCGQPLEQHFITLEDGVAHTVVLKEGRKCYCSLEDAGQHYLRGEIYMLVRIVRSLRYRAGQLRNAGGMWDAYTLNAYADTWAAKHDRLIDAGQQLYKEQG